jgi:hypothetical protein
MPLHCNICARPVDAPWRHLDATGAIVDGCVAEDHTGPLLSGEDLAWHLRPEAVRLRAEVEAEYEALAAKVVAGWA